MRDGLLSASRLILFQQQLPMRIGHPRSEPERIAAARRLFGSELRETGRIGEGPCEETFPAIDARQLFAVWFQDRPLAVAMFRVAPDGTAYLWAPEVDPVNGKAGHALAVRLLREALKRIDAAGCPTTLSVIRPARPDQHRALMDANFHCLGKITTFQKSMKAGASVSRPQKLSLVPWRPDATSRFASVIERTADGAIGGFSGRGGAGEALLESYARSFGSRPVCWSIGVQDGIDVAILLTNELVHDHSQEQSWEIVYLGVIPERRRRGIASGMVASLSDEAGAQGCQRIVVTAQNDNVAAVALYRQAGFTAIDRNVGYVRMREPMGTAMAISERRSKDSDLH